MDGQHHSPVAVNATPRPDCRVSYQSRVSLASALASGRNRTVSATRHLGLIRFGGRVNYVDLVSSSFVEESLQAVGGIRISIQRSLVAAGERPVAI